MSEPVELAEELVEVSSEMFGTLIEEKSRLLQVEYRLNTAAARLCGSLARPRIGALVGSSQSIGKQWLREAAARDHGLSDELRVLRLVPGGAFERADLREGDTLLAIGDLRPRTLSELKTFLIKQERDTLPVRFRRGSQERQLDVALDMACPVLFELASNARMIPEARGKLVVVVPRGLLRYASSDDLLAAAVAHQLAHMLFDVAGESDLEAERKADHRGAAIAALAGYAPAAAIRYWEDVARAYPWLIAPRPGPPSPGRRSVAEEQRRSWLARSYDHFDIARRMAGLRAVIAEIESRRAKRGVSPR